jgi:hypothetical protein
VNFTREPIIETIISPREGNKLLVRNSKGGANAEEYYVDAVEVVSFGQAFFFRSMERPKAFLVPVSDYEVVEAKETRVALKNVSHERNIKIGGGREASMRHREPAPERTSESSEEEAQPASADETGLETAVGARMDKRRDRGRRRRHRRSDDQDWQERRQQERPQERTEQQSVEPKGQGGGEEDEPKVSSPMFSSLIPPPPTLISETLSRYKDKEFAEGMRQKEVEDKPKKEESDDEDSGSGSTPLHRVAPATNAEIPEVTATFFSPLQSGKDSFFF